jgi:hypothetical protein
MRTRASTRRGGAAAAQSAAGPVPTQATAGVSAAEQERTAALFVLVLEPLMAHLPADTRARLACTRKSLRDAEPLRNSFLRLDLSRRSSVSTDVTDALLRGIAALARGALELLDVRGHAEAVTRDALHDVITANLASLREVYISDEAAPDDVNPEPSGSVSKMAAALEALVARAPLLRTLQASGLSVDADSAVRLLRTTAQPGAMRISDVRIAQHLDMEARRTVLAAMVELTFAIITGHPAPPLRVEHPVLRVALRKDDSESVLHVSGGLELFDGALWAALLRALVAHPTLEWLTCGAEGIPAIDAVEGPQLAAALGTLVAANALLHHLELQELPFKLTDAFARPLVSALAANTHLRALDWTSRESPDDALSDAFLRDELLPAVAACASLRDLWIRLADAQRPALREAEEMVAARTSADAS